MIHYGDITKIDGYKLPIVDCITGGSPCQDLSVAGKRAGLDGERSGLFMEQIRIVKEMRAHDKQIRGTANHPVRYRPNWLIWENVPGAFSSGSQKGADFQAVLSEIVSIVKRDAPVVAIPRDGWPHAGCIMGIGDDGQPFSVAWRLHDAQFWGMSVTDNEGRVVAKGTPQRRKRIALVADFGGSAAPDILFEKVPIEQESVFWDTEPIREARKGSSTGTEERADRTSYTLIETGGGIGI